ncbi:MAG: Mur ligase family protein [Bacteroidota bacterium]|nr:Mur ligase family protein [Bacteroidota bacterium]
MTENNQKVHFIAIGGSVMHNLAIALHKKGFRITGSDDEIFEPSYSRLQSNGILPTKEGWNPENITPDLDAIILGMHARIDNPELLKAQDLGLKVYSYPEYIYEQSKNKHRIVIAGSHGKTTITSIILHVLNYYKKDFDYLVGAQIEGFDLMVKLTDAPIIVIEGDEYLSSPIDKVPKFLHYKHHIGLISGVSWDHINVFPTMDEYVRQFDKFADSSPKAGTLIYCEEDDLATVIGGKERENVNSIEYNSHNHKIKDGQTYLVTENGDVPIALFGRHNMQNISGAKAILNKLGITNNNFYESIQSFTGAAKRLELLHKKDTAAFYKDFAHAPSKLEATAEALKEQYPERHLTACLELHTFSSLNKKFLGQYQGTFSAPDTAIVYFSPKTVQHKKLEAISENEIKEAFQRKDLMVFTDSNLLKEYILSQKWHHKNLLMMSSGTFDGLNLKELSMQAANNSL